jgi:hypothetical protein
MCKTYQVPQQECYKDTEDQVLQFVLEKKIKTGFLFHGRLQHVEGFDVISPFKIPLQVCKVSAG